MPEQIERNMRNERAGFALLVSLVPMNTGDDECDSGTFGE
jgi:hypothetical protein